MSKDIKNIVPTLAELKQRAVRLTMKMLDDHEKAPKRGTWNRFLGKRTTSKYDVVSEFTANLQMINKVAQLYHGVDVAIFEDEDDKAPVIRFVDSE
tara:strand:- start:14 stop:301 length:288 start_codon:yes stop_codon:yes gene_type:complete